MFPFKYKGELYKKCTKENYDVLWCATEVDVNGNFIPGKWGKCGPDCRRFYPGTHTREKFFLSLCCFLSLHVHIMCQKISDVGKYNMLYRIHLEIRNKDDPRTLSLATLNQDINEGFYASTRNYIEPYWRHWEFWGRTGVTSIELKIDQNCTQMRSGLPCEDIAHNTSTTECQDITQTSLLHCDCRYLTVHTTDDYITPRISNLKFSRRILDGIWGCTEDINMGRGKEKHFPLYLCWNTHSSKTFLFASNIIYSIIL